ncbi:MAG: hypothetical protein Q9165_003875 [Trypethelium subeluteriae]
MALIQTSLIWVAYAVALVLCAAIASVTIYIYQTPRERAASVTTVCIFTMTALLATVLLMPVDIALVSSTSLSSQGRKKDWATPEKVEDMLYTLRVVYYTLYSLDAVLCLLVIPFSYFYYEDYDEVATEQGNQTIGSRIWGALKYTVVFLLICIILFLIGFFVPAARSMKGNPLDLDYFKHLLSDNPSGLALLPVAMIRSAPSVSAPDLAADTASQLQQNRERQRQLEMRNEGRPGGLDSRDRRELEALTREERTLIRRERLAAEATGEGQSWLVKTWNKLGAIFRPVKLLGGLLLVVLSLLIFVSMLITGIDKAKNSICKTNCGYVLGHINIFQPLNWIFVKTAKVFPIDYVLFLFLTLLLFSSSIIGIATIGIRFLWVTLFTIRKGHTSPQALLTATVLLTLIVLALNYSIAMLVAPQYATFGPQTYCDMPVNDETTQPSCKEHPDAIKPCSELASNPAAHNVCTPSVVSTFINRINVDFPFFGVVDFWAQFAFLGIYLIVFVTTLVRAPRVDMGQVDADLEEREEEGLLASTGRRFGATWNDIVGRGKDRQRDYGTGGGDEGAVGREEDGVGRDSNW